MYVTIIGNLTRDPELNTGGKTPWVRFTIAENYKDKGEQKTNFWNCVAFNGLAEGVIAKYAKKGSAIVVTGVANQTKKDGVTYTDIAVDRFQFHNSGKKPESGTAPVGAGEYPDDDIPDAF
jgi:single-stranded DNA-binding protein